MKPTPSSIRRERPLSALIPKDAGLRFTCALCGRSSSKLGAWREHDERDRPLDGPLAVVFIGDDHPDCMKRMQEHPRLYAEETGDPGMFPRLCGDCPHRVGLACDHPDLKKNGGEGLRVELDQGWAAHTIICGAHGRLRVVHHAVGCAGKP